MKILTESYDLVAWRRRMDWTQAQAAAALGLSLSGYCEAEYRCADTPGQPVRKTVAMLARMIEDQR